MKTARIPLDSFSRNVRIFRKNLSRKFNILFSMTRKSDILHEDICTFMTISHWSLLRKRNISQEYSRENKKKLFSIHISRKSCRLWDYVKKFGTARQARWENNKWRMRFACRVRKARTVTHTHNTEYLLVSHCNNCCRSRLNVIFIVPCVSCLLWWRY
jgi:hypothetical protein